MKKMKNGVMKKKRGDEWKTSLCFFKKNSQPFQFKAFIDLY
jgi:hypothetical protein